MKTTAPGKNAEEIWQNKVDREQTGRDSRAGHEIVFSIECFLSCMISNPIVPLETGGRSYLVFLGQMA